MASLSRFLPEDFDATRPVALIAGQRRYPILVAERIRAAGVPLRLIAFEGETEPSLVGQFPEAERTMIKVGQLGRMLKALQAFDAGYALMAGQISPRRLFGGLHPDLKAIRILASLKKRNAETIFGAIASEVEALGIRQLDARAFLDDQLATPGMMTPGKWKRAEALELGTHIAGEMARLDVGQGVVVNDGTVLAIEAFEGTDAMLKRAGTFGAKRAVFVKTVKTGQDYRFDVPVFGAQTLDTMHASGIRAAALKAGCVIMLDKDDVIAKARQLKIQLTGY